MGRIGTTQLIEDPKGTDRVPVGRAGNTLARTVSLDQIKTHALTDVVATIGLGNVTNTSDMDKPVSTAQQEAIDAVNASTVHIEGEETVTGVKRFSTSPIAPSDIRYYMDGQDGRPTLTAWQASPLTVDVSAALAALCSNGGIASMAAANHFINAVVAVPAYTILSGQGMATVIKTANAPATPVLFRVNTDGAGGWPVPYPGELSSKIGNMYFSALNASTAKLTAFEIAGSQHLHDIHAGGIQTLVEQINQYSDMVRVERVGVYAQPTAADGYVIDLQYPGDGVVINQALMYRQYDDGADGANDPATGRRVRGIRLRYKRGATISNILNGDIYLDSCGGVFLSALHMEDGLVTFASTSGKMQGATFWMRGDGRGELSITPLVATASSANPGVLDWSDCAFIYQQGFPGGYTTTKHNFTLTAPYSGIIRVSNFRREIPYEGGQSGYASQKYGVTCGMPDFDNYSHMASVRSEYIQDRWNIHGTLGSIPSSDAVIDTAASTLAADRKWTGATGTYYYKAQLLLDKMRLLGMTGTAETALSPVNNGNCPVVVLTSTGRANSIIRLYRGTVSGSYDYFVDIPLLAGSRLADSGTDVAGYPWVARAVGGVDNINGNLMLGLEIRPGEFSAASDAYGNATVRTRGSASKPAYGSWRRGDVVLPATVYNDNVKINTGYQRLTDCTLAAPSHVLGTDWVEIWYETKAAAYASTELASATNTVNTVHKQTGKSVFCSTLGKPLWATNSLATSPWVDSTGTAVITPT